MDARITVLYDEGSLPNTSYIGAKGSSFIIEADGETTLFGIVIDKACAWNDFIGAKRYAFGRITLDDHDDLSERDGEGVQIGGMTISIFDGSVFLLYLVVAEVASALHERILKPFLRETKTPLLPFCKWVLLCIMGLFITIEVVKVGNFVQGQEHLFSDLVNFNMLFFTAGEFALP